MAFKLILVAYCFWRVSVKKYVVKGLYTMVVEAGNGPEAKQTSERILRHEGVKAVALDVEERGHDRWRHSRK